MNYLIFYRYGVSLYDLYNFSTLSNAIHGLSKEYTSLSKSQVDTSIITFFELKVNLLALYVAKFERCSFESKKVIVDLMI